MDLTRQDLLMVQLMEECAEVQQLLSKIIRFGLDSTKNGVSNKDLLKAEFTDLLAVSSMLIDEDILPQHISTIAVNTKIDKVEKYLKLTEELRNKKEVEGAADAYFGSYQYFDEGLIKHVDNGGY